MRVECRPARLTRARAVLSEPLWPRILLARLELGSRTCRSRSRWNCRRRRVSGASSGHRPAQGLPERAAAQRDDRNCSSRGRSCSSRVSIRASNASSCRAAARRAASRCTSAAHMSASLMSMPVRFLGMVSRRERGADSSEHPAREDGANGSIAVTISHGVGHTPAAPHRSSQGLSGSRAMIMSYWVISLPTASQYMSHGLSGSAAVSLSKTDTPTPTPLTPTPLGCRSPCSLMHSPMPASAPALAMKSRAAAPRRRGAGSPTDNKRADEGWDTSPTRKRS